MLEPVYLVFCLEAFVDTGVLRLRLGQNRQKLAAEMPFGVRPGQNRKKLEPKGPFGVRPRQSRQNPAVEGADELKLAGALFT